jgi:predicted nucleotidyltransferase
MKIKNWKKAAHKFADEWKDKKDVEIIYVTGSYVSKSPGKYSDIDVYVIVDKDNFNPIKGLRKIDGFIIEYQIVSFKGAMDFLGSKISNNDTSDARGIMFMNVLYDKSNKSKILKNKATRVIKKSFSKPSQKEIENLKYELWNLLYSLKNAYESKSPMFRHVYSLLLFRLIRNYGRFAGAESFSFSKYYMYLTSKKFRKGYHLSVHPDKLFSKIAISCIEEKSKKRMLASMNKLVNYVLEKMGSFDEAKWEIKRY